MGALCSSNSGDFISNEQTVSSQLIDTWERLIALARVAKSHPDAPLLDSLTDAFPELQSIDVAHDSGRGAKILPEAPPALWGEDRNKGETPPDFIRQHYGPWLEDGLTRPALRRLDPKLYQAYATWLSRHPDEPLKLPSSVDDMKTWVTRMGGPQEAEKTVRELERQASAARRRLEASRT